MRPSHISYAFLSSFLAATFALQWWQESTYPLWLWIFLVTLCLLCFLYRFLGSLRIFLIALVMGILTALLTVSFHLHIPSPQTIDYYATQDEIAIRGTIIDDPDRRPLKTNYTVEAELLRTAARMIPVHGRVRVSTMIGEELAEYGDEVIVRGVLERPGEIEGFRYDHYLSRDGVYSVMSKAMMQRTGENRGNPLLRVLYSIRRSITDRINTLLPEPHASLLVGLLMGGSASMPQDLITDFQRTGLTHLVAISGYNITMLITVMGTLLFWLPLKWRFVPSVILIIGFTLLTGASSSAVRAAVMGILGLTATQLGRTQTTRLSVLWTAFAMIVWNPAVLWYDAGFHLSFLALLGVMELSPLLKPYFSWIPEIGGLREMLCLTVSAQLLASPWILFLFGQLSVIAPVSNLLAPPVVPYATLFGIVCLCASAMFFPLGKLFAFVAWLPLGWIIGVARVLGTIPYAALQIGPISTVWIVLYYGLMTTWITLRQAQGSASSVTTRTAEGFSFRSTAEFSPLPPVVVAGSETHAR